MTTHPRIITLVVYTLAAMAGTYMLTLAACVLFSIEPKESTMRSFEAAGIYVLGAFTGILVNTRTQPSEPVKTEIVNPPSDPVPTTTMKAAAIIILTTLLFVLSGCAGLPPRTYSVYGESRDGTRYGGSVTLADTRGLSK